MANERQQLIEELKQCMTQDVMTVKDQVEALKTQFYRAYHQDLDAARKAAEEAAAEAGEVLTDWVPAVDALETQFRELLAEYKQKKAAVSAELEKQMQQNLLAKQAILEQMKQMAESETADVMGNVQKMRDLQAEWKNIGAVPPQHAQEIWKLYQQYQEQFYDLVKINIELRDLDFKKNLELKTLLCEAAEKLASHPSIVEASRALQQLHDEWAEIGPVAREEREALWARFKEASTIINKKHQAYFDDLHKKEQENLEKKQALIVRLKEVKLDELKQNKHWDAATELVQQVQNEWRTIGFAPKKQNQAIYDEYRALCDGFFKAKTAFYKSVRDELSDNMRKKKALIEQVEALLSAEDRQTAKEKIIALQAEWKTIGPVAHKYSDEIWKKFSGMCDEFFQAAREAQREQREKMRTQARERFQRKADGLTDHDKLLKLYRDLQQEIKTAENNILFFTGKSKTANKLVEDMQRKIDGLKKQLHDLEVKIQQSAEAEETEA